MPFEELPGEVESLDEDAGAAMPPQPSPEKTDTGGTVSPDAVHYTDENQRCGTCNNFDEAGQKCNANGFPCSPGGHCDTWVAIGGGSPEASEEEVDPLDEELDGGSESESEYA